MEQINQPSEPPAPANVPDATPIELDPAPVAPIPLTLDTQINALHKTGTILSIGLPYTGNDGAPLLAIEATPLYPTLNHNITFGSEISPSDVFEVNAVLKDNLPQYTDNFTEIAAINHPVIPLGLPVVPGTSNASESNIYMPVRGVNVTQVNVENAFSRKCRTARSWTGSLIYCFRVISQFTVQGYAYLGIINGEYLEKVASLKFPASIYPYMGKIFSNADDYQSNGFVRMDFSDKKHATIMVPYQRNLDIVDMHYEDSKSNIDQTTRLLNSKQYIVFCVNGTITAGSSRLVQIELEIAPGPDFRLFTPTQPIFRTPSLIHNGKRYNPEYANFYDCSMITYTFGDHSLAPANYQQITFARNTVWDNYIYVTAADISLTKADKIFSIGGQAINVSQFVRDDVNEVYPVKGDPKPAIVTENGVVVSRRAARQLCRK